MSVPYQRLHPRDVDHLLDWVEEEWKCGERLVESRDGQNQRLVQGADLGRLTRALWAMPTKYHDRTLPILAELEQARLDEIVPITKAAEERVARQEWRQIIVRLRMVVADWDRQRKTSGATDKVDT